MKTRNRRISEGFFEKYYKGRGLNIGLGGDIITAQSEGYDFEHGNAQYLKDVEDNSNDFVYSSHTISDPLIHSDRDIRLNQSSGNYDSF